MSSLIVTFEDLNDDAKAEIFSNPNIQSLCLQFVGRVKRLTGDNQLDKQEEANTAADIAAELMEYLPFNALELTEDDGTTRLTTSPSEITFTLAYYMSLAGIIPK